MRAVNLLPKESNAARRRQPYVPDRWSARSPSSSPPLRSTRSRCRRGSKIAKEQRQARRSEAITQRSGRAPPT